MRTVTLVALMLALVAAPPLQARAQTPPPAAQAVANDLLTRFDSGPLIEFMAYLHDHWPGFHPTDEFADRRAQSGGYELVEVKTSTDTLAEEVIKAKLADDYFLFRLEVGAGPDHPIRSLSFQPIPRPADVPAPKRLPADELVREIDGRLSAMGDFSGALLVAEDGRLTYTHAEGLADQGRRLPNTVETQFRIASMGKMFTAVAILQLNQAGKLDLDATVGSILKDYPNADFAQSVTIRQLLTHTGGAGDFMSKTWADNFARLTEPADYIAMFGTRPPEFKPGSRFSYANYGYVVLGRIVEVVSGQGYEDYLRNHVFRPAGMAHSSLNAPPEQPSLAATQYVATAHGYQAPPPPFLGAATPAGGAYSTVGDLLAFAQALTSDRLLDHAHTDLLLSPKVKVSELPGASAYAYGFEVRGADGIDDVGHDGGGPGENGSLRILNHGRAVVVVLSNVAPTWRADKLCAFIAARMQVP